MRFISATYIFDGKQFLNNHPVLVLDDKNCFVEFVDSETIDKSNLECYEGIICPGFVNAHCHLELSHMLGAIKEKQGFLNFGKSVISQRNSFSKEKIEEAIIYADKQMVGEGIVAVGDISNTSDSFEVKTKSNIFYTTFIELIGLNPERADGVFHKGKELQSVAEEMGLKSSLVPHAPYSVSTQLMRKIANESQLRKNTITIHNQENPDENLFFEKKEGDFVEFYKFLNIPIDYFEPSKQSSLRTYLPSLLNQENSILVHNTFTSIEEIKWANALHKKLYWCTCPNANLYIENTLPDLRHFVDAKCKMVIGTDSLASNNLLSIISEMNVLMSNFKWLKIADVLKWATYNGAEALGLNEKFGGFIKGKNTGFNHLTYKQNQLKLEKKLA